MSCLTSIQGLDLELFVGDLEIKQGYIGNKLIYNSGSIVRYHVDTNEIHEYELEKDADCIPSRFTPVKKGWTFVGWSENHSSTIIDSKIIGRREDVNLYAVFQRTITLTLYNGSTLPETYPATQYYNNGMMDVIDFLLKENKIIGWSPIGWTRQPSSFTKTIDNNSFVSLSNSATYYSLYDQDVTITTYNGENTSNSESKKRITAFNEDNQIYQNPSFDLEQKSISGLTSIGWVNSLNPETTICQPTGTITDVASDQTYYTTYNKQYTITLYNGSTTPSYLYPKSRLIYGTSTTEEMPNVTLNLATLSSGDYKNKYGWTTGENYTKQYNDGASVKITGDMTFYSLYYKIVTLNMYNGGSTLTKQTGNRYRRYETSISDDPTPCEFTLKEVDITGWDEIGWNTGADNKTATVANGGTIKLYDTATYYSLYHQQFTVTYYNNSTTAGSKTAHRYARAYPGGDGWSRTDNTFAGLLPAQTGISGWTANGWSTSAAADGATINTSSAVTANTTLYGNYKRHINIYYAANGGSGSMGATTSTGWAYRAYNGTTKPTSAIVSTNKFTRSGYTFIEWRNGSSVYKNGATYSSASDITLSAYWVATSTTFVYNANTKVYGYTAYAGFKYYIEAWGASGGVSDASGGKGGLARGYFQPTTNTALYICCGENNNTLRGSGGYNGGGSGFGAGGGCTSVCKNNNRGVLANYNSYKSEVLLVGAGGGGTGADTTGAAGGGTSGNSATSGGKGGSQTAGGAGAGNGAAGSFGKGGNGGSGSYPGGGGGGGYFGGGGGAGASQDIYNYGGGGGSSFYGNGITNGNTVVGDRVGNGWCRITIV